MRHRPHALIGHEQKNSSLRQVELAQRTNIEILLDRRLTVPREASSNSTKIRAAKCSRSELDTLRRGSAGDMPARSSRSPRSFNNAYSACRNARIPMPATGRRPNQSAVRRSRSNGSCHDPHAGTRTQNRALLLLRSILGRAHVSYKRRVAALDCAEYRANGQPSDDTRHRTRHALPLQPNAPPRNPV